MAKLKSHSVSSGTVTRHELTKADPFWDALHEVAERSGGVLEDAGGTNISTFKTNYSTVLDRAKSGSVEVVTRGSQRFVILAEDMVRALVAAPEKQLTVGEACTALPTLTHSARRPRATSVATRNPARIPR